MHREDQPLLRHDPGDSCGMFDRKRQKNDPTRNETAAFRDDCPLQTAEWPLSGNDRAATGDDMYKQAYELGVQDIGFEPLEAVSYIDLTPINHGSDQEDGDPAAAVPATPSSLLTKRRAAKRDSARRVRAKRQDLIAGLAAEMDDLEANNRSLTDDIKLVDSSDAKLRTQLTATQTSTMHTRTLSDQLTEELMMLQRMAEGLRYQRDNSASTPQPALSFGQSHRQRGCHT